MSFVYPEILWLLTGLPALGLILLWGTRRARQTVERFVGAHHRGEVMNVLVVKNFVVTILYTGAVTSLIFALAGPQWGEASVEDERRGLDLVFLMDVSNSMSAQDIPPSRLGRSREIARAIAARVPESYKAVVAFKGAATVVVPMTEDPVAFELALGNLTGALITTAGTSLENGLATALSAFPSGSPRHRAIVLFSDGEELQGTVREELDNLRRSGVPVYAVVAGTGDGATVPTRDGGVLRSEDGMPVIVGTDREILEELVEISNGGIYELFDTGVSQDIVAQLESLAGHGRDVVFREVSVDRYRLFVLLTLAFLAGVVLVRTIRWRDIV